MMKKNSLTKFSAILMLAAATTLSAQMNKRASYGDILNTKDIAKIERFLKTAHPQDPRRTVLKPKLIALKNEAWTKGAKDAKPMQARPILYYVPNDFMTKPYSSEAQEFKKLMTQNSTAMKEKTVKLLNHLFDTDISNKEAILLVQNNSDCNMIMRIQGINFYNLAVPAHGENSIILRKGEYALYSNVCDELYTGQKNLDQHVMVVVNNPLVKDSLSGAATQKAAQK